jgi:hypothetical protein
VTPRGRDRNKALGAAKIMIKNGLYSLNSKALDGVSGGTSCVLVLCDGAIYGGDSFFYFIGTYSSSNGRWKGEITSQEHTKAPAARPMAGRVVKPIPMREPNSVPQHSSASEVFDMMRYCGCWLLIDFRSRLNSPFSPSIPSFRQRRNTHLPISILPLSSVRAAMQRHLPTLRLPVHRTVRPSN